MLKIDDDYISIENNRYFFKIYGNIYNIKEINSLKKATSKKDIIKIIAKFAGYFFIYIEDKENNNIYLCNDIFGNYRVYYIQKDNKTYIGDDYKYLLNLLKEINIDKNEQIYFHRHRYTTGFNGLHKGIKKLPPASFVIIKNNFFEEEIYFNDKYIKMDKVKNDTIYKEENYNLLKENLYAIDKGLPTYLFFSGGVDSTYLALMLQDMNIKFKALFIRYIPADSDNIVDEQKVLATAKKLNIEVEIIDLDIEKIFEKYQDVAFDLHPIDKAFSVSFYYTCDTIEQKYGKCNIINGQSSDSIYCWGSSGKTVGSFIQRYLSMSEYINSNILNKFVFSNIAKLLYKYKWNMPFDFIVPYKYKEYLSAILDPQGYLPVRIKDNNYIEYNKFLDDLAHNIDKKLYSNIDFILFYMKFIYLQGTSNIPVVKSAQLYNHNIIMPFVDIRIVRLKMQYQNEYKNLFHPRYVLEEWMEEYFKFNIKLIDDAKSIQYSKKHLKDIKKFDKLIRKIYERWEKKLENITK